MRQTGLKKLHHVQEIYKETVEEISGTYLLSTQHSECGSNSGKSSLERNNGSK